MSEPAVVGGVWIVLFEVDNHVEVRNRPAVATLAEVGKAAVVVGGWVFGGRWFYGYCFVKEDDCLVVQAGIVVGNTALEIDLSHCAGVHGDELGVYEPARLVHVGDGIVIVALFEAVVAAGVVEDALLVG